MSVRAALGEILLVRLRRDVRVRFRIPDFHAEHVLDERRVVHSDRVVVREERADLDADVAADALLKPVLHRLHATVRDRSGCEVLDALHRTELRTLAARKAKIHVHECDFARTLLLRANVVGIGRVGYALLLQPALDDVDRVHGRCGSTVRL